MRKGERIGCIIAIIVIGILFLISSTDLVFKDKTREIYNVCVILENGQQEQYQNLKKGSRQVPRNGT